MFWLIIGIIVMIAAFVALGFVPIEVQKHWGIDTKIGWKRNKRQFYALFGLLIVALSFVTRIPANAVGIVYSPFGGTKDTTLSEGMHTKNPLDKIYEISTEVQSLLIPSITTQTKDAQYVTSALDVKYRVSEPNAYLVFKQYRTLENMTNTLITPTTQRVLELITIRYNVIDVLGEKRGEIYSELVVDMTEELAQYGIELYSISIMDMDAGDGIEKAIEQEAIAKKAVETAEQNLLKAETEAKKQSVEALAKQEAAKIEAETKLIQAEAEKKANEMLTQSLTDEVLQKEWIDKWDGQVPVYYAGDGDNGIMMTVN